MTDQWLVVGAGLTGATVAERIAAGLGQRVHVVDRRAHIAGNALDTYNQHGILVHQYGAHIFHTSSSTVWGYLSRFTDWRPYAHQVVAVIEGCHVPLPFNFKSIDMLFPASAAQRMKTALLDTYAEGTKVPILRLMESGNAHLCQLADFVYRNVYLGYTTKQWGCRPEDLDRSVTGRVPVYVGQRDGYFDDTYQAIPTYGYTAMVEAMLDHPNITVSTSTSFSDVGAMLDSHRLIFTGPVDELLGFCFGPLPYRSLEFRHRTFPGTALQPAGAVNFPNDHEYTRILEHRYFTGQEANVSTLTEEYPAAHVPGGNEPFYPVLNPPSRQLHERYMALARETLPGAYFAGRLADFRYYDMDQAVLRALVVYRDICQEGAASSTNVPLASVTS